jgi:serine/threonine protein kinase
MFNCKELISCVQSLDHPNIIRYLESFIDSDQLIIVLELADAGDLGKMIKYFKIQGKMMPEKTIWKYFLQACLALQHMHSRRIMHRGMYTNMSSCLQTMSNL